MPYPIQQGSPSWTPKTPAPGGMPRPWSIPPRPANDPIRLPRPANDNTRGFISGFTRKVYYGRIAVNVINMWYRRTRTKVPSFDGYVVNLDCGMTGGPITDVAAFNACGQSIALSPASQSAGVTGNRPATIWEWGPPVGPGPGTSTYFLSGKRWVRVNPAGESQVTKEVVTTVEYHQRNWSYAYNEPWIKPFDYPNPFPQPYRTIPSRPVSPLPEGSERGPSPRPRLLPDNPSVPGPSWVFNVPGKPTLVLPTFPPLVGPGTGSNPGTEVAPLPGRPRPRQKEKKVYAKLKGGAARLVSGITETADAVDAIYEALPEKLRKKLEKRYRQQAIREGRWVTIPPHQKAEWIYRYWKKVDIVQAMKNLAINELEDRVIGKLAQGARKTSRRMGGIVGVLTGPAL